MKKLIMIIAIFVAGKTMNAQQNDNSLLKGKDSLHAVRDSAMKNYVSMQAGQMILIENDKVGRLTKDMTMKNGTTVKTDGTVKTKDGRTFQLKEGDRVYMNGLVEGLAKPVID